MNVLISGASGLIGGHLVPRLERAGHHVFRLVRRKPPSPMERQWNPDERVDPIVLDRIDSVIHLAGENIGEGRWTEEKKRRRFVASGRRPPIRPAVAASVWLMCGWGLS